MFSLLAQTLQKSFHSKQPRQLHIFYFNFFRVDSGVSLDLYDLPQLVCVLEAAHEAALQEANYLARVRLLIVLHDHLLQKLEVFPVLFCVVHRLRRRLGFLVWVVRLYFRVQHVSEVFCSVLDEAGQEQSPYLNLVCAFVVPQQVQLVRNARHR